MESSRSSLTRSPDKRKILAVQGFFGGRVFTKVLTRRISRFLRQALQIFRGSRYINQCDALRHEKQGLADHADRRTCLRRLRLPSKSTPVLGVGSWESMDSVESMLGAVRHHTALRPMLFDFRRLKRENRDHRTRRRCTP